MGRVDNGRPILKVTLYVAENPGDRVAHNFLDTPPGYLAPPTCSPPPLPSPSMERRHEEESSSELQLTVSKAWPCLRPLRVDEDGHSDKRIPRRRNPRFETAISRSIGDRSRLVLEETEDHGGGEGGEGGRSIQALDRMEIRRNNGSASFLPS